MSAVKNVLLIGGSGFVSGALARASLRAGHTTYVVTRGHRPVAEGVKAIAVDRHDQAAFQNAIEQAGQEWDSVVDCIGYEVADARQDVAVFRGRARQFVFISTDFVFDPARRLFPQPVDGAYVTDDSYGAKKRRCEMEFINGDCGPMQWTIFRPCHIYGPGSQLGCLPEHARDNDLIARLRAGQKLRLVGGGHFLQQPLFADDLAGLILSVMGNTRAAGKIYPAAGPEIIESRRYYEIIAQILGVDCSVEETGVDAYLQQHPDSRPFLCHRIYDLSCLKADGLACPSTTMAAGLEQHVRSLA